MSKNTLPHRLAIIFGAINVTVIAVMLIYTWHLMSQASTPQAAAESNFAGWFIPLTNPLITAVLMKLSDSGALSGVPYLLIFPGTYLVFGTLMYAGIGWVVGKLWNRI